MASIAQSPRLANQIGMFAKMQMAVANSKAERGMSCYAEQKIRHNGNQEQQQKQQEQVQQQLLQQQW